MISIREVAKLAGVSPATVSRVLNGTAKVDDEKEKRIREVIAETGYVPNEVARSLFKRSSRLIGFIVPNIENPFFSKLAHHLENAAYEKGYRILLCNTDEIREKETESIQMLKRMNADGLIITSTDEHLRLEAEQSSLPVVIMDREVNDAKGLTYIASDHYQGGRLATEHLIQCGCKHIVCMKGPQEYSSGLDRYRGYRDVCAEQKVQECTVEGDFAYEDGLAATEKLLKEYPDVDGIFTCCDVAAFAALKVLTKNGKRIPEDVQVIGFDDVEWSSVITPELTTIAQNTEALAESAMLDIIRQLEEKSGNENAKNKDIIIPVHLVERESTRQNK